MKALDKSDLPPLQKASIEATKCLSCYDPPCVEACPVHLDVPTFIRRIKTNDIRGAVSILREKLIFPGVCGLICPHMRLCEGACCYKEISTPISIGVLQHFAARIGKDIETEAMEIKPSGKKVVIVGSGPAGLAAGHDLMMKGHDVSVFETHSLPGGLLIQGIPHYRLPQEVPLEEIQEIRGKGLKVITGKSIKSTHALLKHGYDAVLLTPGAPEAIPLGMPGEELKGVIQGIDFTRIFNQGTAKSFSGKKAVVIGGGDVAIDSARCAVRLGADMVYVVYRRSFEEMPAYKVEVEDAKREGVCFLTLALPVGIAGEKGHVRGLKCIKTRLGKPDKSGRRRPIPIPETEFEIEIDTVIEAIGQRVDNSFLKSNPSVETERGLIKVNERSMTSHRGIFAAGDAVNGGTTVVQSIVDGKRVAVEIDKFLKEVSDEKS